MGKFQRNKSITRTVVCKLLRFKDKHKVLLNAKKLKDTGIFIYEDFSKATMELRKSLRGRSFTKSATKQNSIPKLQKHFCQRPYCKIIYLLFLLMSVYLYFLDAFNTR